MLGSEEHNLVRAQTDRRFDAALALPHERNLATDRADPKWGFDTASSPNDQRASERSIYPLEAIEISTSRRGASIPTCIEIRGDDAFRSLVEQHLAKLRQYRSGSWISNALQQAGRRVTIAPGKDSVTLVPTGLASATDTGWTVFAPHDCNEMHHLYCFEQ